MRTITSGGRGTGTAQLSACAAAPQAGNICPPARRFAQANAFREGST